MAMDYQARAKLNLCLHVTGRRADGYHLLESLVVFVDLADRLEVAAADALSLVVTGAFADAAGAGGDNLVLRAARLLQQHSGTHRGAHRGAQITLAKQIPVGAGLGGGSADAAAALRALNDLWQLHLPLPELAQLGALLGADVPMCLTSAPLVATGVGEVIAPLTQPLPAFYAVLAYPHVPVLSRAVYAALTLPAGEVAALQLPAEGWADAAALAGYLAAQTRNDLQPVAMHLAPEVAALLQAMEVLSPTPLLVRMTGSGSCCFALFADSVQAKTYADALAKTRPKDWVNIARMGYTYSE